MSGEQFQQWSQGSLLLSLDRFHLKQTPVLNFNCRDSLGFPSYILHKKTFFLVSTPVLSSEKGFLVFGFHDEKRFASFQMFASFFIFVAQVACFASFQNVCIIFLEFWLEGLGARLGILWDPSRLGFFGGSLFFLGLWEHPKFRGSLFFLKVDPVKLIGVFLNFSFGFHGLMLNRTVDKIQNASRQRNFNLIFLLYKFFELLQLLLKFKGQFLFLLTPVLIQLRRVNI